ncbi:hypothetical protein SAMN04489708_104233 [Paracidovorax cattleyae]|uniref:Uncharacterized protein n=1 Tax=Paracidovorax cattleyae TaxID=80868 RepID=A0A1H0N746_9BURK|nr:hypothetical protein [Paracidovorax cattleyae]SDO88346.1 hypothetical protein SAMN04489708_104233 [Paracidovorax cattleyae]
MFSPRDLDLKSLALHTLVAQKMRSDHSLLLKAQNNLERMVDRGQRCS